MLFLCTHNAGRSQMALGFFQYLAGDQGVAWSGGSEPGIAINPAAVEAMKERGIDISGEFPKPWTEPAQPGRPARPARLHDRALRSGRRLHHRPGPHPRPWDGDAIS